MDFPSYYSQNIAKLDALTKIAHGLVENLIRQNNIDTLAITSRTKTLASCLSKIENKSYRSPISQITDLVGIRVIVYFEHQIEIASSIIRDLFDIDEKNSFDQSKKLGSDRLGYRSNHFICKLGRSRKALKEYKDIYDISFEVQIRTILQHAWAELAHDRSYKLSSGLPSEIQRDVNLYAGLLEISDKAFSRIVREIDLYAEKLDSIDIQNEEINSLSLIKFVKNSADKYDLHNVRVRDQGSFDEVVQEVKNFGISNIGELSSLIDDGFLAMERAQSNDNEFGFIRNLLMWSDLPKYLTSSWNAHWTAIDVTSFNLLKKKFRNARSLFRGKDIDIEDYDLLDNDTE
ncbi:MAG: hypothetical protein E5X09_09025, partial [Mesorhizobium sp.]